MKKEKAKETIKKTGQKIKKSVAKHKRTVTLGIAVGIFALDVHFINKMQNDAKNKGYRIGEARAVTSFYNYLIGRGATRDEAFKIINNLVSGLKKG